MGRHVLIAEDEANIVEALTFILSRSGFEVTSVRDGAAVLDRLRAGPRADLLILDVMLPGCNGLQVLKAIRSDAGLSDTPVLMLTAKAQPPDRELARQLGADAYVAKPFSNTDLVEQVRHLVDRRAGPADGP